MPDKVTAQSLENASRLWNEIQRAFKDITGIDVKTLILSARVYDIEITDNKIKSGNFVALLGSASTIEQATMISSLFGELKRICPEACKIAAIFNMMEDVGL